MILYKVVRLDRSSIFAVGKYDTCYEKGKRIDFGKTLGGFCFINYFYAYEYVRTFSGCVVIIIEVECDESNFDDITWAPFVRRDFDSFLDNFYGLNDDPDFEFKCDDFIPVVDGTCLARKLKVLT